jgi:hypothetical protein
MAKKWNKQRALTHWRGQTEGQIRMTKETERVRDTHILERAEEESSQNRERNEMSKGHSRTGECTGQGKS